MNIPIPSAIRFTLIVIMASLLGLRGLSANDSLRTVTLTGAQVPNAPTGVEFINFDPPVLNDKGETAFHAFFAGPSVDFSNDDGVLSEGGGSGLKLVARDGDPAPGTATGVNFGFLLGRPVINDAGHTAFYARLVGDGIVTNANDRGLWSEGSGATLGLVARTGNQAPGKPPGSNFSSLAGFDSPPVLNNLGQTTLRATSPPPGGAFLDQAIWSEGGGSGLALIASAGDQAPGTAVGVNFAFFGGDRAINNIGQTAFLGFINGPGIDGTNDAGIWSEGGSSGLDLLIQKGSQAPGLTTGINFDAFEEPVINDAGHTAFLASVTGMGVDGSNDSGIWSEGAGSGLDLIAREGSPAPGTASGINFGIISENPILNGEGHVAFRAFLSGPGVNGSNNLGLWAEGDSGLSLVAREGEQAPDTPSGTNFRGGFTSFVLNDANQAAFKASTSDFRDGIWAEDISGQLRLIVREGDTIDVDDGPGMDLREVSGLQFGVNVGSGNAGSGNQDGRTSSFNDIGQVAFSATFTDGSRGVFVSNLVAIPEPSSVALALGCLACMLTARTSDR